MISLNNNQTEIEFRLKVLLPICFTSLSMNFYEPHKHLEGVRCYVWWSIKIINSHREGTSKL